jgi:hypothetical protein
LALTGKSTGAPDTDQWWTGLPVAARELVFGALAPYIEAEGSSHSLPIGWATDLFFVFVAAGGEL